MNNWYKIARNKYESVVNTISRIIISSLLKGKGIWNVVEVGTKSLFIKLNPSQYTKTKDFPSIRSEFRFSRKFKKIEIDGSFGENPDAFQYNAPQNTPPMAVEIRMFIPYGWKPYLIPEIMENFKATLRHELEHFAQTQRNKTKQKETKYVTHFQEEQLGLGKPFDFFATQNEQQTNFLKNAYTYFTKPNEIEAFAVKYYYLAKKLRKPFLTIVDDAIRKIKEISMEDLGNDVSFKSKLDYIFGIIKNKIVEYAQKRFPTIQ